MPRLPVKSPHPPRLRRSPLSRLRERVGVTVPKTKAGKAGMIAGGVIGGLLALDLLALAVTAVVAGTMGLR